ncbi:DoxX family protein [Halorussus caseinilyticus]|uniref:DoxX family protein n=1 Tax=Halorussus caseinilyticus TaxID=3034025 RepID=A0ABD5WJJ7_9EURY|nr:DoxX family protein [Halorussus sp. DT72]
MSVVGTAVLGIKGLLGIAMLGAGGMKVAGAEQLVEDFDRFGYPQWFRSVTGGIEVVAGLALFASFVTTSTAALAAGLVVAAVMAGAVVTHARAGDATSEMVPPAALFVLALVVSSYSAGFLG